MTYPDALAYLSSFVDYERTHQPAAMRAVKLERMRRLCQRLGEPQRRYRSILIAGTNGKGSISAMLYSMLRASSLRAGLYTSPHLEHLRERIRVGNSSTHPDDWISEADFAALVNELRPIFDESHRGSRHAPLTYFEVVTALALMYFRRREIDVAVVEVGLGGRLDATNILEPAVSVLGSIDVDHTDVLGHDPVLIAREKAGIIKPNQTLIMAPQQPDVADVIRSVCEAQGVPLVVCGLDSTAAVQRHSSQGLQVSIRGVRGRYPSIDIPLIGRHQASNAAVAVMALEALSETGIPHSLVERGLAAVEWPGRLELVSEAPTVILDGAHNPLAAQALRTTIEELWPRRRVHLLIGVSSDKLVEAVGQILGPLSVSATCTQSRHPRALDASVLAQRLAPFCRDVHSIPDPLDAYTHLFNTVGARDVIVVTGSLFLVGELRAALRRAHLGRPPTAAPQ